MSRLINIVDGETFVGVYSPSGEFNGVISEGDTPVGAYHPSGAYNVTPVDAQPQGLRAPDGSHYIINTEDGPVFAGGAEEAIPFE